MLNLQTLKPTARQVRMSAGVEVWGNGGRSVERVLWRVTFPDSPTGYIGATIEKAVALAYRCRLMRMTCRSHP